MGGRTPQASSGGDFSRRTAARRRAPPYGGEDAAGVLGGRLLPPHPLPQLGLEAQLLDLARQRVAAPAEPGRRFHPVASGVRERAADERLLELLLQPVADIAL